MGERSALHPQRSPNQIRSLNLIREFLGGRGSAKLVNLVRLRRIRFSGMGERSALHPERSPNQIRSLNLIREFLGGRGSAKLVNLVRLRRIRFSGVRQ